MITYCKLFNRLQMQCTVIQRAHQHAILFHVFVSHDRTLAEFHAILRERSSFISQEVLHL